MKKLYKRFFAAILSVSLVLGLFVGFGYNAEAAEINKCGYEKPVIIKKALTKQEYENMQVMHSDILCADKATDNYWSQFSKPYYSYSVATLSVNQKTLYDDMYNMLYKYIDGGEDFIKDNSYYFTPYISYSGLSTTEVGDVVNLILIEHPELYYISNMQSYSYYGNSGSVRIGVYDDFASGSARQEAASLLKDKINWYLSQINDSDDNYNKEKTIHDLICDNVTYNLNAKYSQTCASVFLKGESVCAGYSEAFELLMNALDIPTVSITSNGHQWNQILLDGAWYIVDVTWDDQDGWSTIYEYFNISDNTMRYSDQGNSHVPCSLWTNVGREECLYDYGETSGLSYYSLSFNGNGASSGSVSSIEDITTSSSVTIPECGYSRTDYTFVEWNTKSNGSGVSFRPNQDVSGTTVAAMATSEGNVTLYAIWKKNETTPVKPDDSTPVKPDDSTPVKPDEDTPIVPDEDTTSGNVISTDSSAGTAVVVDEVSGGNVIIPVEYITQGKVYRMYDPNRGEHFYTKDASEASDLVKLGWVHESNADFTVVDATDVDAIPVYRMYNPHDGGMHFYTERASEAKNLTAAGWRYEGISHYVFNKNASKGVVQYRLYNPNSTNGEHNWTTDVAEWDNLKRLGWRDEGACWKIL